MVAEVLHPVDVDPYIWRPVEALYQSPSSIVHTHPGNDLGDKKCATCQLNISSLFQPENMHGSFKK